MKAGVTIGTKLNPNKRSNDARDFETAMRRKIVGQDVAVEKVAEIYQMFLAGLNAPGRPVGNLLFLGPTGSGKTRVVEAMAESLFGDARACIKIDCAEFQHSHEIAKLIGSPPGYLGHRETHPLLTQEALNQWHTEKLKLSILLFDEIEKASDSLWQLLLGILDKATLTLGDNRRVDLSSCIIIMTSNLGAADMNELMNGGMGFANKGDECVVNEKLDDKIQRTAVDAAKRKFTPEFMNRIDKSVVFKTLRPEHLVQILEIELGMVQQRVLMAAGANQFVFNCTPAVKTLLLKEGTDPKYGARHLKRAIERNLVFPLANLVATGQVKLGDFVRVDIENDELTFTKEAEGAMVPVLMERYGAAAGGDLRKPVNVRPVVQRTPTKDLPGGGGTSGFGA
jgi:ATP-dependent Clp protease ATP-binding subunit ClpB